MWPQIPSLTDENEMHAKEVHMHYACIWGGGAQVVHLLAGWPSPHCSCYVQKKACESQLLKAGQLVEKKKRKKDTESAGITGLEAGIY